MDRRNFLKTGAAVLAAAEFGVVDALAAPAAQEGTWDSGASWAAESAEAGENDLRVRFLGTGAAGWKGPGSKSRRNSSVLLDGRILIDLTVSVLDMLPAGFVPRVVFYTHSHGDHYQPAVAIKAGVSEVYVSDTWETRAREDLTAAAASLGVKAPKVTGLRIGQKVTVDGITLTALPANHATAYEDEQALIYLLEKGGGRTRVLYATDTGGIPVRAARIVGLDPHIAAGRPITGFIMEATFGLGHEEDFRLFTHSGPETVLHITNMLIQNGRYLPPEGQPVYLTHMSYSLHDKLDQSQLGTVLPKPLRAAYDGLEVVFKANL